MLLVLDPVTGICMLVVHLMILGHVPSSPFLMPLPLPATTTQAESEESQETLPNQLSQVERALLRRAVVEITHNTTAGIKYSLGK